MNSLKHYKGKCVLVTGHTGFKGSWLALWLQKLGAQVIGYAKAPQDEKDNFVLSGLTHKMVDIRGDIRDFEKLNYTFNTYKPDYIFHLAAQPIVSTSYKEPVTTYETNVMGTIYVLECMRRMPQRQVGIFITSDKCYENKEQLSGYREGDLLGGYDPYSSSKGASELAIASWRNSFMNPKTYATHQKSIASVRAGNVIGGGDWSKDRIIPDCIRSIELGEAIHIRNPKAIRPWQHVLEPLSGYLLLGEKLYTHPKKYAEAWNFGPFITHSMTVKELVTSLIAYYGEGEIIKGESIGHETSLLNLDISKSIFKLNWQPTLSIEETIQYTVDWYKRYQAEDVFKLDMEQIQAFENKMNY